MDATAVARRINDNLDWSRAGEQEALEKEVRPKDIWSQIEALESESDESFVCGLYLLFLGRMPDGPGLTRLCEAMAGGMKRADVIRALALSDEAGKKRLDVSWLSRLNGGPAPAPRRLAFPILGRVFWRLTKVRPRGAWLRIKKGLRRFINPHAAPGSATAPDRARNDRASP